MVHAQAIGKGWRMLSAEDGGTNGEVQFVHEAGTEERVVEFAATFAKQAFDLPFLAEQGEGGTKIDFVAAADFHFRRQPLKRVQPFFGNAAAGQNDDGGKLLFK